MRRAISILGLCLLCGCVGMNQQLRSRLDAVKGEPEPVCDVKTCPDKWTRAQIWLTRHSNRKIQIATDSVLQTYNVINGDPVYNYTIVKEPVGDGNCRISANLTCGNFIGCVMKEEDVRNMLYHYINTGEDIFSQLK